MSYSDHMTVMSLAGFLRSLREPPLQPLERAVLGAIASARGGRITSRELINMVWGEKWRDGAHWEKKVWQGGPDRPDVELRVLIYHLRHTRGFDIRSEYGRGYYLVVSRDTEAAAE